MRELTWKEKLIDKHFGGAVMAWCGAIEHAIDIAPEFVTNVYVCPAEEDSVRAYELENEHDIEFSVNVSGLPVFDGIWTDIVQKIAEENGVNLDIDGDAIGISLDELNIEY